MWQQYLKKIMEGDTRSLARCISLIENEVAGYETLLELLPNSTTPIIGITGPPGSGKSTLTDALIALMVEQEKTVAVLCIDPSSPFNFGALLGDRLRMNKWYNNPSVFIRSLATRGSLGGLHPKIIELSDLLKIAGFDYIIIETVGVGQSEIEIAGLADTTIVVLVPEAGDEIQTMKAGLMEIANLFVVNKCDRLGADIFVKNLQSMLTISARQQEPAVEILKTIASQNNGIEALYNAINRNLQYTTNMERHSWLLAEKAYYLIQQKKMKKVDKKDLQKMIELAGNNFNLYRYIKNYTD